MVLVPRADPAVLKHPGLHLLGLVGALGVVVGAAGAAGTPVVDALLVGSVRAREAAADGAGARRVGGHCLSLRAKEKAPRLERLSRKLLNSFYQIGPRWYERLFGCS